MQTNYAQCVIVGYLWTLDDMVNYVINQAGQVNNVQVIVMIVEGCVLCSVAVLYVWFLTKEVCACVCVRACAHACVRVRNACVCACECVHAYACVPGPSFLIVEGGGRGEGEV